MKCPKCSYVSFDFLDACRKCSTDLADFKAQIGLAVLQPGDLDLSVVLQDDLQGYVHPQPAEERVEESSDVMVAEQSFEGPPSEGYMTVMLDISDMEDQSVDNLASPESLSTSQDADATDAAPSGPEEDRQPAAGPASSQGLDAESGIAFPDDSEDAGDSETAGQYDSTLDMLSDAELSILEERNQSQPQQESAAGWEPTEDVEASPDPSAIDLSGLRAEAEERDRPPAKSPRPGGKPADTNDASASRPPKDGYVTIEIDVDDIQEDDQQERQSTIRNSRNGREVDDAAQINSFDAVLDLENDDVDEEENFLIDLETLDGDDGDDRK